MTMGHDTDKGIDSYVADLSAGLALPASRAREVTDEVRAHLEDAVRDLRLAGLPAAASEREAVRRFGAPAEIAAVVVATERRPTRLAARARRPVAALLIAAALAALGGGAVASAHTPPAARVTPTTTSVGHAMVHTRAEARR